MPSGSITDQPSQMSRSELVAGESASAISGVTITPPQLGGYPPEVTISPHLDGFATGTQANTPSLALHPMGRITVELSNRRRTTATTLPMRERSGRSASPTHRHYGDRAATRARTPIQGATAIHDDESAGSSGVAGAAVATGATMDVVRDTSMNGAMDATMDDRDRSPADDSSDGSMPGLTYYSSPSPDRATVEDVHNYAASRRIALDLFASRFPLSIGTPALTIPLDFDITVFDGYEEVTLVVENDTSRALMLYHALRHACWHPHQLFICALRRGIPARLVCHESLVPQIELRGYDVRPYWSYETWRDRVIAALAPGRVTPHALSWLYIQMATDLLSRPHTRAFLTRGALAWRLGLALKGQELLDRCLEGISTSATRWNRRFHSSIWHVLDDDVTQSEMDILVGMIGSVDRADSFWPPLELFLKSIHWNGEWSRANEIWFTARMRDIRAGLAKPETRDYWERWAGMQRVDGQVFHMQGSLDIQAAPVVEALLDAVSDLDGIGRSLWGEVWATRAARDARAGVLLINVS